VGTIAFDSNGYSNKSECAEFLGVNTHLKI